MSAGFARRDASMRFVMRNDGNVTVTLRPVASPVPLAFLGLLIASVVISGYELGWIPTAQQQTAGWILLAVPIPLQLLAACWGFAARSPGATAGSAVLAASWIAFGLDLVTTQAGPPGPSNAAAFLMFASAAALLVPVAAELALGSLLSAAVLATTIVRFALTGVSGVTHRTAWVHASGWTGIVVAAAALYAALALELEASAQRAVLRRARARTAIGASLDAQIAELEHEPGVRSVV
jgi:succinate-acetate transporter protein